MLDRLHPDIKVLAQRLGATDAEIASLKLRYPLFPSVLLRLMSIATELELAYRGTYLRLYGPVGCAEMDDAYHTSERIPAAMVIGDNGGSQALIFLPSRGICRVSYGAVDVDEVVFVAEQIEDLLFSANIEPDAIGDCRQ